MITSTPRCISTTVCTTAPPSKTRDAPWVRLVSPDVTAASWSARSWGKPALNASGRPSEDTTTACATSGTRSTKLVISQLRSCAGRPGVLMGTPLVARSYRFLLLGWLCVGLQGSYRSYGSSVWGAAARPSRTPRWKLAMRVLAASGDLVSASASASPPPPPTEPGTRLALGTRFGRPAWVVFPADGTATAWAARQPSSAGEIHVSPPDAPAWAPEAGRAVLRLLPLRRNQSDSSES